MRNKNKTYVDNKNLETMKEEMNKMKEKMENSRKNCSSSDNGKTRKNGKNWTNSFNEKEKLSQTDSNGFRVNILENSMDYIRKKNKIEAHIRSKTFHTKLVA